MAEIEIRSEDLLRRYQAGERSFGSHQGERYRVVGDLSKAVLPGIDLSGADVSKVNLEGADLSDACLVGLHGNGGRLGGADLSRADLREASFSPADLMRATLTEANLSEKTRLVGARLQGAKLDRANLENAELKGAFMTAAVLDGAVLRGAQLQEVVLDRASLLNVEVNASTSLTNAKVDNCRVSRHVLESLDKYGGLTNGDRIRMRIDDGAATLRASYGGFKFWVHSIALVVFAAPYISFMVQTYWEAGPLPWQYSQAECNDGGTCRTMGALLWEFIWTGGRFDGAVAWAPFLVFWYALAYNTLRAVLLKKTKELEMAEKASGLPPIFSLPGRRELPVRPQIRREWPPLRLEYEALNGWGVALWLSNVGFAVNIGLVALHAYHFLQIPFPAP